MPISTISQTALTLLFSLLLSVGLWAQNSPAHGISVQRMDRLQQFVEQQIEEGKLHGAVCLVERKGQMAYQKSYGYSNLPARKAMKDDQIFYIQSMTKPIISVAFMMLYEEGHFLLSDPLAQHLPQFSDRKVAKDPSLGLESELEAAKSDITLAQVLSHTAGFSHGLGSSKLDKAYLQKLYYSPHENVEARVNALASMPLVGHPGEQWYYSASPDILSLLIEKFSGMNTAEFLQKRLFDPLGMTDTGYNLPEDKHQRASLLHNYDRQGKLVESQRQTPNSGHTIYGGTHGLFSTAADYLRFCKMLLNGGQLDGTRYLSRKTIELMTADHVGDLFQEPGFGFGLGFGVRNDLAKAQTAGSLGQFFWNGAYNTYFIIDPQEDLIAIMMMQFAPYTDYYKKKFRQFIYQAIVD